MHHSSTEAASSTAVTAAAPVANKSGMIWARGSQSIYHLHGYKGEKSFSQCGFISHTINQGFQSCL